MASSLTGPFRTLAPLRRVGLSSVMLAMGLTGAAQAQPLVPVTPYGYADSYAGPLIHGDYVGAPLTRFPRPSELVPSAWGYGTYGVPTVAGIRSAPVGTPTVYVLESPRDALARAPRRSPQRVLSRTRGGSGFHPQDSRTAPGATENAAGARVITVPVPGRQATLR